MWRLEEALPAKLLALCQHPVSAQVMLANEEDTGAPPPCQKPGQGFCDWVVFPALEGGGPFTLLKVPPGQVGAEAEYRCWAQHCHFGQDPTPFWASVGSLAASGHLS